MDEVFYMVYMVGGETPTQRHSTSGLAQMEAERLTLKHDKKTFVLRAEISVEPAPKVVVRSLTTSSEDNLAL